MHPTRTLAALGLALTLAACGSSGGDAASDNGLGLNPSSGPDATSAPAPSSGSTVTIEASKFAPKDLSVAKGTTVVFDNIDPFAHTVTSSDDTPAFDSGRLEGETAFEHTFDEAGTFAYFCEIHPTMRGTVTVE